MKIKFIKPFRFIGNAPDDGPDGTVPVGYIVDLENDESTQWLIDNGFAVRATYGWLHDSGEYYTLGAYCTVSSGWGGSEVDEFRRDCGLVFKTDELAQRFVNYLKAVETVSHDEGFMKKESDCYVSSIVENSVVGAVINNVAFRQHAGEFYFDTYEHAEASLKAHRPEWNTIFDYDWSKE